MTNLYIYLKGGRIVKKILTIFSLVLVVIFISSCRGNEYEIALITDVGTINDKSFNQGSWEGVVKYAEENDVSHKYYQPKAKTDKDYLDSIKLAVDNGAKVVVTPGFYFEPAIQEAQSRYKDVTFIIIDGRPQDIQDNVYSILYAEEQSGFLAGYAAVKEGFTNLGYMGGQAVPSVQRFGLGYIQGAEYAAKEMDKVIQIRYKYLNLFEEDASIVTEASAWYQGGIEVIFVAAGGAGGSVMAAAEDQTNPDDNIYKYVIGVDVDQKDESETVITSAMKELKDSVYMCLKAIYEEDDSVFTAGEINVFAAENNGVRLSNDFSRFKNFTKTDYNDLFTKLKNNTDNIRTNIVSDIEIEPDKLELQNTTVTYEKPTTGGET
jgi:basic membrane protein A